MRTDLGSGLSVARRLGDLDVLNLDGVLTVAVRVMQLIHIDGGVL